MHPRRHMVLPSIALLALGCDPPREAEHAEHGHHPGGHDHPVHAFTNAEEWAKSFDDPARDAWQKPDAVIASLALAPNTPVADLGASTGPIG